MLQKQYEYNEAILKKTLNTAKTGAGVGRASFSRCHID